MALTLPQKKDITNQIAEHAKRSTSVLVAKYSGMTVKEITDLRRLAQKSDVLVKVIKNTLARRALVETSYSCINSVIQGPLMIAFSFSDPSNVAKVFREFSKTCPSLKVTALSLDGRLFGSDRLKDIASLPTREQALGQLLFTLQAPIAKVAQTLQAVPVSLLRTVLAIKDVQTVSPSN